MTPTGLPSLTPPAQPGPFGMPKEKWGQLSNILGGAARAFGQSDYNPRTGERSTWGSRLGGEMQDVRQQEIENRSRNIEDMYREAAARSHLATLQKQQQQDEIRAKFSTTPGFMDIVSKKTGLTPEESTNLINYIPANQVLEFLKKPEGLPAPDTWLEEHGLSAFKGMGATVKDVTPLIEKEKESKLKSPEEVQQELKLYEGKEKIQSKYRKPDKPDYDVIYNINNPDEQKYLPKGSSIPQGWKILKGEGKEKKGWGDIIPPPEGTKTEGQYTVGKTYTDAQGRKAKYLGPKQWQLQ